MNVQQLVKLNNERQKKLSKPYSTYYEDLLVYIRLAHRKDEQAKEEVLLEMLEHLIEAEQNGVEADAVFGKSPKQLADEIIDSLPSEKKMTGMFFMLETVCLMLGMYITSTGIFNIILKKELELHVGNVFITIAAIVSGFFIVLPILLVQLRKSTFKKSKVPWLFSGITMMVYIFGVASIAVFLPPVGQAFSVTGWVVAGVGVALNIIYIALKLFRK